MIDFYKPNLGTLMPLPGSGKSLRIQLTACFPLLVLMSIYFFSFDVAHPLGDSATHPIEPLATRLGSSFPVSYTHLTLPTSDLV